MRPGSLLLAGVGIIAVACSGPRDQARAVAQESAGASRPPSPGPPAAGDADSLIVRGQGAYDRAQFDSAGAVWRVALAQARAAGDTVRESRALTGLGLVAWKRGDYAQGRALGERALALKLRAGLHADLWRSYNALGLLAWSEGRLDDALVLHHRGAEIARAHGDESGSARSAHNLALVYTEQGSFAQARAGLVQARDAFHRLGNTRNEGRALSNLGMLDTQMGDPRSAITSLAQARLLYRVAGDPDGEQNALGQLGTAYDALGESQRAFATLDSALTLSREHGLRQEEASNLELIATLHREAGDPRRALELFEQASRIDGELGLTVEQGTNRRGVAEIQAALGRPDLAREYASQALLLHRTAGVRLQELRDLLLLADLAAAAGERPAAVDVHLRAADHLGAALDARVARVELALARARIADRSGDSRGVLRVLQRANHDLALGGYGGEWQAAGFRARAFARLALLDSAAAAGREAVAAVERVRGNLGSSFLRSSFASDKAGAYDDLVEILLRLDRNREAFEVADGARSHALLEHLAAVNGEGPPASATVRALADGEALLRRIDGLVARLDTLEETPPAERDALVRARSRALATELANARGSYEALLVRAAERDAAGTALLGGRSTRADEIQAVLRPDEAVVEFLVTPERVIAFVVTRSGIGSVATGIARNDLARRVRLALDLLGQPGGPADAPREVLIALHATLITPIERAGLLRGVRRVIVVPHSVLAYLPFAALQREGSGRYLVEEYSLLHVPSAAALGALRAESSRSASPGRTEATAFAPFPRQLPGTLQEARAFRKAVDGARAEEGAGATEVHLRRALTGGGMVHIASHGVMNPRNPMFSRIELATGGTGPGDDGRLEVHELLALRIGAPLIFLSGCETGIGAAWSTQFARGEDYATLAQAFLYAGARNVTATLWRIQDEGAAVFAERFYGNLRSMAPAEALAAAQRDLLHSPRYASPYYWAGYQLSGDGEPWSETHRVAHRSVQQR